MADWSRFNTIIPTDDGGALLFNARTGALIRLNSERREQLDDPGGIPSEFADFLANQGFLINDGTDEISLLAELHSQARHDNTLFSATVELTEACNFRCLYCYQNHRPQHLDNGAARRVTLYLLKRMSEVRHIHVNWFGGEPLLRMCTLERISERLAKEATTRGCIFTQFITTNGYYLTEEMARRLRTLGISNVQITVDGDQRSHNMLRILASGKGTYAKVLNACEEVVNAGMELMVRVNVNRWNADRIPSLLSDLISRGISPKNSVIHVVRAVDHGNCSEYVSSTLLSNSEFALEWIRILKLITAAGFSLPTLGPRAYNCAFDLGQTVMIGTDATIRHCSSSSGLLGEIDEYGNERNTTPLREFVKKRTPFDDPTCRECHVLPMCMGGCGYLQELGREKCNPEKYVLKELVSLTACQSENPAGRR